LAALNKTAKELKSACKGITNYADLLKSSQTEQLRQMMMMSQDMASSIQTGA
jgi:hypothetical protein